MHFEFFSFVMLFLQHTIKIFNITEHPSRKRSVLVDDSITYKHWEWPAIWSNGKEVIFWGGADQNPILPTASHSFKYAADEYERPTFLGVSRQGQYLLPNNCTPLFLVDLSKTN